jgi:hypothetical protein
MILSRKRRPLRTIGQYVGASVEEHSMDRRPHSAFLLSLVMAAGWAVPAAAQDSVTLNVASGLADAANPNAYLAGGDSTQLPTASAMTAAALVDPLANAPIAAEPLPPGALPGLPGQDAAVADAPPPRADPWPHKFVFNGTAGTLGAGPEFGWRFAPRWGLRVDLALIGFGLNAKFDNISYKGDLRLGSGGGEIDWYFSRNSGWHLSAGLRYDSNVYHISAAPKHDVTVGGLVFTPAQLGTLRADIAGDWQFAPTATIGHTWRNSGHLQFGFELGAMFHNRIEVKNLRSEGGTSSLLPDLVAAVKRESGKIKDDLNVLNVFPILQLYIGYSF